MIFVELHKCNLTNSIISEQTFEDSLHQTLINKKKKYSEMITKLAESSVKENEIYNDIINLLEENKNMYL